MICRLSSLLPLNTMKRYYSPVMQHTKNVAISRVGIVITLCLTLVFSCNVKPSRKATPNILFIVADDLGYSDLGSYGGEIDTPNLDALAEGGVRLTQFYTMGRCCPSRASILTGQYPHRVGLGHMTQDINQPGYRGQVSDQAQTIAQALKPAGYRSFIAGKWHLGTPDPTQHGFEEFYGTLTSAKRYFDPDHLIRLPKGRNKIEYPEGEFYATDAVTDHALDFLNKQNQHRINPGFSISLITRHIFHYTLDPRTLLNTRTAFVTGGTPCVPSASKE